MHGSVSALLLCAGESLRMGRPKAFCEIGGQTLLQRALTPLVESRVDEIVCVTGAEHDAISASVCRDFARVRTAHNPDFSSGIMGSIQTGLRALSPACTAFLITLVDLPFLTTGHYNALCTVFGQPSATLARFRYLGQPAHPAGLAIGFRDEILREPKGDHGLRVLFARYSERVQWIEDTRDSGVRDVDTEGELHAHLAT
jgi:molybdenum cofactor cytidylyltransferase